MNKLQKHIYAKLPRVEAFLYKESFVCSRQLFVDHIRHIRSSINTTRGNLTSYESDPIAASERYLCRLDRRRREERERIANLLKVDLKPLTDEKHYGIEIECVFASEDDFTSARKELLNQQLHEYVQIKYDGSIECDCENPDDEESHCECVSKEFALLVPASKVKQIVTQVTTILNDNGAFVNRTCGLHVHFDMRDKTSRQVSLLGSKLERWVTRLKTMLPKSRRENRYCMSPKNTLRSGDRYACVNLHAYNRYKTLEVRMHSGTTDATKILLWIELLDTIMSKTSKVNTTWEALSLPPHLMLYIQSRINKFAEVYPSGKPKHEEDNDAPVNMAA